MTLLRPPHETADRAAEPGAARCPGVESVQDVYRREIGDVLPDEFAEHWSYLGDEDIPKDRYTSKAFHDLEVDRVWKHTWQMACREDDLPAVGDTVVYEVAGLSTVLVRTPTGAIKAFWNSCLHRGTQLRSFDGTVPELRCQYHGWAWNLDGTLKDIPCAWDLPHVDRNRMCLPELAVGTWGGFVFVNPDLAAPPLERQLAPMPDHFRRWPLGKRAKTVHVAKVFRANWKVAMAAFMEGYHVPTSHPQGLPALGDLNIQYDCYDQVSRILFMQGVPSPALPVELTQQEILDATLQLAGIDAQIPLPEGMSARAMLAMLGRQQLTEGLGLTLPDWADADLLDIIVYYAFPNLVIWAGYALPLVYRFRPYGDDPQMSVMEIMMLAPLPDDADVPPGAEVQWLGPDESFSSAPQLGPFLAPIFDQDQSNIVRNQIGLRTSLKPGITLSNYQESLVRHHDQVLDRYVRGEV